jgi:DNA replication and repair protein RecF
VVAPNGSGKTNLLEAMYLLATGNSERAHTIDEMIGWGAELASVTGVVEQAEGEYRELAVVLTRGQYLGKPTPKRRYLVDGVARLKAKFIGNLTALMFRPEDMRLIEGSPSRRRAFLDDILIQADFVYGRALTQYEAALKRRNKILDYIREGRARREQLAYWDQSLIKNGNILTEARRDFADYMSGVSTRFGEYQVQYDASPISPSRLEAHIEAEVALGYTLVGPHKDDFRIISNPKLSNFQIEGKGMDLMVYGSRGEQRLAVLFLKLASLQYLEERLGVKPILLLDDIFSELDDVHRREVVAMTSGHQTILTTAELDVAPLLPEARIVKLGEA